MTSTSTSPLLEDQHQPIQPNHHMPSTIDTTNQDPENPQPNITTNETKDQERSPLVPFLISLLMIGINVGISFVTATYYECAVSFGVNILSFVCYAWPFRTEKFYDFTGMITFLSCDIFSIVYNQVPWNENYIRNIVLFFMVMVWTLRLGIFLFQRISKKHEGKDKRFDNLRNNFAGFLIAWLLQASWGYFCCMPLFITNSIDNNDVYRSNVGNITIMDIIGWILWFFGWVLEIVADRQKTVFKNDPNNNGKFCNVGLWSLSRHPNYFGEITLWIGIFISSTSIAKNSGWLILLCPVWTIILLVFSSGIPLAERTAIGKYGEQEEYQQYVKRVSVLIPLPCCWKGYI